MGQHRQALQSLGIKPWEVNILQQQTPPAGEMQLFVTKGKTYNSRAGQKQETEPR